MKYECAHPKRISAVAEVSAVKRRGYVEVLHVEEDIYMFASVADHAVAWMCDAITSRTRNFIRGERELRTVTDRIREYMKLATNVVEVTQ